MKSDVAADDNKRIYIAQDRSPRDLWC